MTRHRNLLYALLLAVIVMVADQISKSVITAEISRGERVDVIGPLQFTLTYNDGIAFGMASGGGIFVILLAMIALVALGVFVGSAPEKASTWVAGGLIFGGAVGNLIDRIRLGHVTDFIHVPNFPTFNLADAAITVGVVILSLILILDGRDRKDPGPETEPEPRPEAEAEPQPEGEAEPTAETGPS